jgi:predicted RNA methylase
MSATVSCAADKFIPDPALSYWATPTDVADDLVYLLMQPWHWMGGGVRVLEPSAGEGHLLRAVRDHLPESSITAVEPDSARAETLRTEPGVEVVESTIEQYLMGITARVFSGDWEPFHLVVMNPPFTLAGRSEAWAEHLLAIYRDPYLMAPGGTVGAVVPRIVMTGKSKRVREVRELIGDVGGVEECRRGAFASRGAQVSTALLWAQKPFDTSLTGVS